MKTITTDFTKDSPYSPLKNPNISS